MHTVTHVHTNAHTDRHTRAHRDMHTDTKTYKYRGTHRHTQACRQTHTGTHTETHKDRHRQTETLSLSLSLCPRKYSSTRGPGGKVSLSKWGMSPSVPVGAWPLYLAIQLGFCSAALGRLRHRQQRGENLRCSPPFLPLLSPQLWP